MTHTPSISLTQLATMRKEYVQAHLSKLDVAADPFVQFEQWLQQAVQAQVPEPTAMSLATVAEDGKPSSRIVLLKGVDEVDKAGTEQAHAAQGLLWFTNYNSRKGIELAANPQAALLFHWVELEREVRIEGRVEKVSEAESEAYFHARPLPSRLGALASAQSARLNSRAELEATFIQIEKKYGDTPPRPACWGGYRLVPEYWEFWQGRRSRLHDRIVYQKIIHEKNTHIISDSAHKPKSILWRISRLAP